MDNTKGDMGQMLGKGSPNQQQLAVFYTGNDSIYAINISKVKAFIITEETVIDDTPTDNKIITGIATIRGEPITLLNLDVWLGNPPLDIKDYKLIVFCEFSNKQVGILVKDMVNIVEKNSSELSHTEDQNSKLIYTTYVNVHGKDLLCSVFNAEQLLEDIGWTNENASKDLMSYAQPVNSDKIVLVADDSPLTREMIETLLNRINVKYAICDNGEELLNKIKTLNPQQIGMVVTDIEMPEKNGYQITEFIKGDPRYSHIPVIINSSMATGAVRSKMEKLGIDGFVAKPDIKSIYEFITKKMPK